MRSLLTLLFLAVVVFAPASVFAQSPTAQAAIAAESAAELEQREHRAMLALGAWAVTNVGVGSVGWATSDDEVMVAFHQMNVAWNAVNLGIAVAALAGRDEAPSSPTEVLRRRLAFERILLVNAGLDVGYIAAGWALAERGVRRAEPQTEGIGYAIMVQGAFLLAFDWTVYALNRGGTRDLWPVVAPMAGADGGGAMMSWCW